MIYVTLSDANAPQFELVEEPVAVPAGDTPAEDQEDDRDGQED